MHNKLRFGHFHNSNIYIFCIVSLIKQYNEMLVEPYFGT